MLGYIGGRAPRRQHNIGAQRLPSKLRNLGFPDSLVASYRRCARPDMGSSLDGELRKGV